VAAVEAHELVRTYVAKTGFVRRSSKEVEAVRGISFEIAAGELFGLLGPNGAGKTTTIKLLTTLLLPTSGRASVLGFDVATQTREVRRRIGYVFGGERGLYDRLTGLENLKYFADLYRVSPRSKAARISELLELVGLTGRKDERVEGYSRGMRQRLHIARGLLHDPPVVFLDEPTIGLDPVGARELRDVIGNLASSGKAVLLTTHYMFEADALCDRIAVIDHGRIVAEGTPDALKRRVAGRSVVEIETFGAAEETIERLRRVAGVASVTVEQREQTQLLVVQAADGSELVQPLLHELEGTRVGRVSTREPTLEDAYVDLVSAP
jgi:ABC-2 type transport system ATP-binding protein